MQALHLTLSDDSPAIKWAQAQANSVGALGHVGTHLDCYTKEVAYSEYKLRAYILDCTDNMPSLDKVESFIQDIQALDQHAFKGQAIILHTNNLTKHNYGDDSYFKYNTALSLEVLHKILALEINFILIDSHGIGAPGNEHQEFDKLCEKHNCHVIENVNLSSIQEQKWIDIKLNIDKKIASTGKPCEVFVIN